MSQTPPKTLDMHAHIGDSIFGYHQNASDLLKEMDALQIDMAVISTVKPRDYHFSPANDEVAMAVQEHPDRLIAFARIDPRLGEEAEMELIRCIKHLGMKGLFLHPWEETFPINSQWVKDLMPTVEKLKIPVMLAGGHVRVSMASQIADLARSFPHVPLIATSGGQINISGIALGEAEEMLLENPNVYLETSGIYREDFIEDMVPKIGIERIVFGSNSPEYSQAFEVLRPRLAHLSDADKQKMCFDNAARLLKLD